MNYEIINTTENEIDTKKQEEVIQKISETLNVENGLISIVLTNDSYIQELNKNYRNIDAPTDVISFAFLDDKTNPNLEFTNLGEIYISIDKAKSQAEEYNHSFERELCFLTCHGILHLLGYDHINKKDEEVMFKLQEEILKSLNIER